MCTQCQSEIIKRALANETSFYDDEGLHFEFVSGELTPVFPEKIVKKIFACFELVGEQQTEALLSLHPKTLEILSELQL